MSLQVHCVCRNCVYHLHVWCSQFALRISAWRSKALDAISVRLTQFFCYCRNCPIALRGVYCLLRLDLKSERFSLASSRTTRCKLISSTFFADFRHLQTSQYDIFWGSHSRRTLGDFSDLTHVPASYFNVPADVAQAFIQFNFFCGQGVQKRFGLTSLPYVAFASAVSLSYEAQAFITGISSLLDIDRQSNVSKGRRNILGVYSITLYCIFSV